MNSKYYRALMEGADPLHPSQVVWRRELKRCIERERARNLAQKQQDRPYIERNCIKCPDKVTVKFETQGGLVVKPKSKKVKPGEEYTVTVTCENDEFMPETSHNSMGVFQSPEPGTLWEWQFTAPQEDTTVTFTSQGELDND